VVAAIFAVWRFSEKLVIKLQDGITSERYISVSSKIDELFMLVQHGSRFYMLSIFILLPRASFFCKLEVAYLSLELRLDSHLVNFHYCSGSLRGPLMNIAKRNKHIYAIQITLGIHCIILSSSILYSCADITAS
jgi:hypothetical protein